MRKMRSKFALLATLFIAGQVSVLWQRDKQLGRTRTASSWYHHLGVLCNTLWDVNVGLLRRVLQADPLGALIDAKRNIINRYYRLHNRIEELLSRDTAPASHVVMDISSRVDTLRRDIDNAGHHFVLRDKIDAMDERVRQWRASIYDHMDENVPTVSKIKK